MVCYGAISLKNCHEHLASSCLFLYQFSWYAMVCVLASDALAKKTRCRKNARIRSSPRFLYTGGTTYHSTCAKSFLAYFWQLTHWFGNLKPNCLCKLVFLKRYFLQLAVHYWQKNTFHMSKCLFQKTASPAVRLRIQSVPLSTIAHKLWFHLCCVRCICRRISKLCKYISGRITLFILSLYSYHINGNTSKTHTLWVGLNLVVHI